MRNKISASAKRNFINRQLVETRQITKHVKNILKTSYPNSRIIPQKASLINKYRKMNNLYKSRSLNDFHHAHDAYLGIFVGEFIEIKMPWLYTNHLPTSEINQKVNDLFEERKVINLNNSSGLIKWINFSSKNWNSEVQNEKPRRYFSYKDCFITHLSEKGTGEFYDENIQGSDSIKRKTSIKKDMDVSLYGGRTNEETAYFSLYVDGNKVRVLKIPVQIDKLIQTGQITLDDYINDYIKDNGIQGEVLRKVTLKHSYGISDGHPYYFSSDNEWRNGKPLIMPVKFNKFMYFVEQNYNKDDLKLYDEFSKDFEDFIIEYRKKLTTQYATLRGSKNLSEALKEDFINIINLNLKEKVDFIMDLVIFTQTSLTNTKFIKYGLESFDNKGFGRINDRRKRFDWRGVTLIDQSVTGYYERRMVL